MRDGCRCIMSDIYLVCQGWEGVFMLFTKTHSRLSRELCSALGGKTALGIFFPLQYDSTGNLHFSQLFFCGLSVILQRVHECAWLGVS